MARRKRRRPQTPAKKRAHQRDPHFLADKQAIDAERQFRQKAREARGEITNPKVEELDDAALTVIAMNQQRRVDKWRPE